MESADSPSRRETAAVLHPLVHRRKGQGKDKVQQVVDLLAEKIIQEEFRIGEKLPPEGALTREYKVSRTVIREAMRILRVMGLINMSQGRQPSVRFPDIQPVAFAFNLLLRRSDVTTGDLIELRKAMESESSRIAASRVTREQVRKMQRNIYETESANDREQLIDHDIQFHLLIAEATGNPIFVLFLEMLQSLLRDAIHQYKHFDTVKTRQQHQRIMEAIATRDEDGARQAMLEHLTDAERELAPVAAMAN